MKTLLTIFTLLISTQIFAKSNAFIKVTGSKQGLFKSESLTKSKEAYTEIIGYNFEEISPRETSTGMPTGKRQLKPLTIIKDWGASSPQYYQALSTNELIREIRIDFFTTDPEGRSILSRSIVLNDASVEDIKDASSEVNGDLVDSEAISFVFRKITISDKSGTVYTDDVLQNN